MNKEKCRKFLEYIMTRFDKKMRQNLPGTIVSLFFPQVCGICGKLGKNSLCKKCEIELKKRLDFNIINNHSEEKEKREEIEDRYFNELIYVFKYEGLIRSLILDYKFNDKSYLYLTFVNFLLKNKKLFENIKKYDKIIPVPISKKRLKTRGYNQSLLIAKEISDQTNLELVNNCLLKTKNIIEQSKLNKEDREKNVQGVYELKNKKLIENKKILLIDDIYTTGNTVNECSKVLKQANPSRIGILVLAKD